jgi:hypothetical protein|tara:strand:- start:1874 stop:2422 length:549 start_codon:yes stop_codon:yes gene_type:complete
MTHISADFYSTLIDPNLDDFSIAQLKEKVQVLLKVPEDGLAELHKRAYRVVLRLEKSGHLEAYRFNSQLKKYRKTDLFHSEKFTTKSKEGGPIPISSPDESGCVVKNGKSRADVIEMLKQCEVDMKASLAEAELYLEFQPYSPADKRKLRELEVRARDKSIKLLGRFNGLKVLLAELYSQRS